MNTHQFRNSFILILIGLGLVACQASKTPEQVSENFWLGMKTDNIAMIKKYSHSFPEKLANEKEELPDVKQYSFGKIIIDGDVAEVETTIEMISSQYSKQMDVMTYLQKENDAWLVDYEKTVSPLKFEQDMEALLGDIQNMTDDFAAEVEESVEEFKEKALPEIQSKLEQAENELREKLPELKSMINEFLEELEKSIEESFPKEEEPTTQQT